VQLTKWFGSCTIGVLSVAYAAWAGGPHLVSGRVVGYDGEPMALAHAHVQRPSAEEPMVSAKAAQDGTYGVEFEGEGLFLIRFTGVNHEALDVAILAEGPDEIGLDVQLGAHQYTDFLDQVWLTGDFNRFSHLKNLQQMTRQPDGTYTVTVEVDSDSLSYQLLGLEAWGRSINGTQSDRFEYDGGGDYKSIVNAADTLVTISFDPRKLVMTETPHRIIFGPGDQDRVTLSSAYQELSEQRRVHQLRHELKDQAIVAEALGETDLAGWFTRRLATLPEEDVGGERVAALERARRAALPTVREMLYVHCLELELLGDTDPGPAVVQEVLANVSAASPFWSLAPDALYALRFAGEDVDPYGYLDVLTTGHPSPHVRQAGFMNAIILGELFGEFAIAEFYWELWQADSAAVTDDYYVKLLAPDRNVKRGNPLPEFSLVSLKDSTTVYTPKSFRDKTLLIDFWASWCPPCCAEMPSLHDAYERYHHRGLEILSIAFDPKREDVATFRHRKWAMPWHHAYAEGAFSSDLAQAFEVRGIPKPILVGGNGVIITSDFLLRGPELQRTLEKVLGP
jgi:thiol-disulfide isomerase/thioredoxin